MINYSSLIIFLFLVSIIVVWFDIIKEHPSYLIPIITGVVTLIIISREKSAVYEMLTTDEAIQNVASVYNADDMIVKNLTVTGTIKTGSLTASGNITSDSLKVVKNTDVGGALTSVGSITATNGNINAPKGSTIAINSYMSGGIVVSGDVDVYGYIYDGRKRPYIRYGDQIYIANAFGRGNISTGDGSMKTSKNTADYESWKIQPSNSVNKQNSTATVY
jgi:hypothetical protein